MEQERQTPETPTVEALVNAFQRGGVSRRDFLRRAGLLGLTAAGAGALADAAGPARAWAQTTQKRELVVAQGGDVSKFDPHFSTSSNDIRVSFNVFDNLTSRHPDQKVYPGLATEWKATGPTTWTFKLRPGVKWHNGDPFTSADAKFSLERTFDPAAKTMVATVFTTIDRIEAPDPHTLVIHTKKSDPLLPDRLAFYGGQIVPKKYLEDVGPDTFNAKPVGTGPMRLSSWVKDDKAIFEAYADYWGGKIEVDRVVFRPIPETAPRVAALLKGEVDAITQLPSDHWDRVNQNATTRGAGALYAGLYVLGINAKIPPLNNELVRQAMALAVDRESIVKEIYAAGQSSRTGPSRRVTDTTTRRSRRFATTPNEGRELVKKSGYKNEPIIIETSIGYVAQDKAMSEAIASMWKDVGLNAAVEVVEYSVRAEKNRNKTSRGSGGRIPPPHSAIPTG